MPSSPANEFSSDIDYDDFYIRYRSQTSFYIFIYPFFKFPRSLAIIWGGILVLIGRLFNGDFLRGFKFALNKIRFLNF